MVALPQPHCRGAVMFDARKYFDCLNMFGIRLGLDAVRELAGRAGEPQKQLKFIHIAGTNGKGSTGAMLERAFRHCGMTTGFYTSPHLFDIRERFRVNGQMVSEADFAEQTELLRRDAGDGNYSYFEFATVLAMRIFVASGCDIVIWETGMGGRLDATNMVTPEAAIITNIALDHQSHLGSTEAAIAGEKAGIIKPGVPLFHGKLSPEAAAVIHGRAVELGCEIFPPAEEVPASAVLTPCGQKFFYDGQETTLALPGKMQRENFRIVREVLKYFAPVWNFELDHALEAMKLVKWPGRFQHLSDRLIVDGGHNPDGVAALSDAVCERYGNEKFTIVYAAFSDKDAANTLPILKKFAKRFIFTSVNTDGRKTFQPDELAALVPDVPSFPAAAPVAAVEAALREPERVIVSGSLYLAGMVLEKFAPESAGNL